MLICFEVDIIISIIIINMSSADMDVANNFLLLLFFFVNIKRLENAIMSGISDEVLHRRSTLLHNLSFLISRKLPTLFMFFSGFCFFFFFFQTQGFIQ